MKQDKYTMDPGRQIYLSNNKNIFGQKWYLNNKIKEISKKNIFNFFWIFFSSSSNYT